MRHALDFDMRGDFCSFLITLRLHCLSARPKNIAWSVHGLVDHSEGERRTGAEDRQDANRRPSEVLATRAVHKSTPVLRVKRPHPEAKRHWFVVLCGHAQVSQTDKIVSAVLSSLRLVFSPISHLRSAECACEGVGPLYSDKGSFHRIDTLHGKHLSTPCLTYRLSKSSFPILQWIPS